MKYYLGIFPSAVPGNHSFILCLSELDYYGCPGHTNHTAFILLWLAYFIEQDIFESHYVGML